MSLPHKYPKSIGWGQTCILRSLVMRTLRSQALAWRVTAEALLWLGVSHAPPHISEQPTFKGAGRSLGDLKDLLTVVINLSRCT